MFEFIKRKGSDVKNYSKKILQTDNIIEQHREIKQMAGQIFNVKDKIKNAKVETFIEAKNRLQLTDVDLLTKRRQLANLFYTNLFLSFCILILTFYFILYSKQYLSGIMTLTVLGISLANCFKFSFRYFQIKHKVLCPVSDWVKKSKEWAPAPVTEEDIVKLRAKIRNQEKELKRKELLEAQQEDQNYRENLIRIEKEQEEDLANYYKEKENRKKRNLEYLNSLREE